MIEWLVALAVLLVFLTVLPVLLRRTKRTPRKTGGGSGVTIAIGMVFAMIFDPKAAQAIEIVDRKADIVDAEDGESGDPPTPSSPPS